MNRRLLKSKIHRATVTDSNLDYEGSVTIDSSLMEDADIAEYEEVSIWDLTNGERIYTYAIRGRPDSGMVCINGAAAHKISRNDIVIIATFADYSGDMVRRHRPQIIRVDSSNRRIN